MKTFKDLKVWQSAYELTLQIYQITKKFPRNEEFGLKSQIRRAAVSIISNIAEGFKRSYKKEQINFYKIAESSLEEVKCQSMLSLDLGYIDSTKYQELSKLENTTGKLLYGWINCQKQS